MNGDPGVFGETAPGFESVREAFRQALELPGEGGGAFALVRRGELVVDLWGGFADRAAGLRWGPSTTAVIFSGSKGLVATCLLMLIDRGELDPDAPVCRYWPEFGAAGKEDVRVVDLASHASRLPGVRAPVSVDELPDDRRMAALLASQPREADPRAAHCYQPLTQGWLCGELVRRVSGRSVGRFFAEEVAGPLGLEAWIGLPAGAESLVAKTVYGPGWGDGLPWSAEQLASDELLGRVVANPAIFPRDRVLWNRRDYRRAEIPAAGGIASARAVARLYGCLAVGGTLGEVRLLGDSSVAFGRREQNAFTDSLTGEPLRFGFGFQLQTRLGAFGPPADAFGHNGAGGSVHCAWPSQHAGLSFTVNTLREGAAADRRAGALLEASYSALKTAF